MTKQAAQILTVMALERQPMRYETGAAFKRHFDRLAKAGLIAISEGPDPEGLPGIVKVCTVTEDGVLHVLKALAGVVAAYKA